MHPTSGKFKTRRTLLVGALASAGLVSLEPMRALAAVDLVVANVTGLYSTQVARIEAPTSAAEVAACVRAWPGSVAVGGGRYSMGGQVAVRGGLHLDMRAMNRLVWFRPEERLVRVQAGMRWRDLQDILDPCDLAVKTMQSYANFTVGGSVSVNAHGRYVGHGPVGNTVRALQLVLADGTIAEASPRDQRELFRAAIGGYGAVGVITEIELELAENVRIERVVHETSLQAYVEQFEQFVLRDEASLLHNADLLPPEFDRPISVTWRKSAKPLTQTGRLVARGDSYGMQKDVIWLITELPGGERLQKPIIRPLLNRAPVVKWLNCEASLDVAEVEPRTRAFSTYALQEYFIPKRNFVPFAKGLAASLRAHGVEALNVSIRHSPPDLVSVLPWAKEEVFAFVLFYKQRVHLAAREEVGRWTRELIDLALVHEGRYYLPYQLHATREQFQRAYPEIRDLRAIKRKFDPSAKFANELWVNYL